MFHLARRQPHSTMQAYKTLFLNRLQRRGRLLTGKGLMGLFLCCALFCLAGTALAQEGFPLDFTVIRLGEGPRTVLVVGAFRAMSRGVFPPLRC